MDSCVQKYRQHFWPYLAQKTLTKPYRCKRIDEIFLKLKTIQLNIFHWKRWRPFFKSWQNKMGLTSNPSTGTNTIKPFIAIISVTRLKSLGAVFSYKSTLQIFRNFWSILKMSFFIRKLLYILLGTFGKMGHFLFHHLVTLNVTDDTVSTLHKFLSKSYNFGK